MSITSYIFHALYGPHQGLISIDAKTPQKLYVDFLKVEIKSLKSLFTEFIRLANQTLRKIKKSHQSGTYIACEII